MIGGEKRDNYVLDTRQPNTSNYTMKTHRLEHRYDRRREKKYVVVTHSLIHQTIQ